MIQTPHTDEGRLTADPAPDPTMEVPRDPAVDASRMTTPPAGEPQGADPVSPLAEPIEPAIILGLNEGDRRIVRCLIVVALLLMAVQWYRLTQVRPAPISISHPANYQFRLDINDATWVEWMQLEGIGETLARRIVTDRQERGPFRSIDDVERVTGIGPKTLDRLRPHLTLAPPRGSGVDVDQPPASDR